MPQPPKSKKRVMSYLDAKRYLELAAKIIKRAGRKADRDLLMKEFGITLTTNK